MSVYVGVMIGFWFLAMLANIYNLANPKSRRVATDGTIWVTIMINFVFLLWACLVI